VKSLISVLLCLVVSSVASAGGLPQNPAASAGSQQTDGGIIKLAPMKHLRKGVDAWPLIANPAGAAEQRVNATLTRLNERLGKALQDCDANVRESMKENGQPTRGKHPTVDDWSRTVEATMTGPRFLSLIATDETDCGGAHPDGDQMAMVFDMTTGAPVNWIKLLPKSSTPSALTDSVTDGSTMGALVQPALRKMLLSAADAECKDAFLDPQGFQLWPDAKHETLVALPFDLPHVVQACANEIDLTMDQARKMGFDETLLNAIHQAHNQIPATPKH
jgi:hypothetical protein